jgi:hypothetical protein
MAYSLYDKHYLQEIYQEIFNKSDTIIEGNTTLERVRDLGYLRSGNYAEKLLNIISTEGDFVKISNEIKFKSGLLAHWSFQSETAIDESGKNNPITYSGTPFFTIGVNSDYGVELVGASDFITSAASFPDFTKSSYGISFWINVPNGVPNGEMNIINKWSTFGFKIYYNTLNNKFGFTTKNSTSSIFTTEILNSLTTGVGVWNHVVLTVNPNTNKSTVFINNIKTERLNDISVSEVSLPSTPIIIGGAANSTFTIDECMIFQNYLSADVVEVLYNNPNGKYIDIRYYLNNKRDVII